MFKRKALILIVVVLTISALPVLVSAQDGGDDDAAELPPQAQFVLDSIPGADLSEVETYIHPDFVWYANGDVFLEGIEGYQFGAAFWIGLFPDLEITVDEMVMAEDSFTWLGTMLGTHTGEVPDIPPTGNDLDLPFLGLFKLEDGKIIEVWMYFPDINWNSTLGLPLE